MNKRQRESRRANSRYFAQIRFDFLCACIIASPRYKEVLDSMFALNSMWEAAMWKVGQPNTPLAPPVPARTSIAILTTE